MKLPNMSHSFLDPELNLSMDIPFPISHGRQNSRAVSPVDVFFAFSIATVTVVHLKRNKKLGVHNLLLKQLCTLNSLIKVPVLWKKTYQNLLRYSLFLAVLLE